MTTIAYDGKTLAADTQWSMFNGSGTKLYKLRTGGLYGACGQLQDVIAVYNWLIDGGEKPKVEDGFHAIIIEFGNLIVLENKLVRIQYDRPYFAVGSGREYAMAAMYLGNDAVRAVEVAIALDIDSGGKIDTMTQE